MRTTRFVTWDVVYRSPRAFSSRVTELFLIDPRKCFNLHRGSWKIESWSLEKACVVRFVTGFQNEDSHSLTKIISDFEHVWSFWGDHMFSESVHQIFESTSMGRSQKHPDGKLTWNRQINFSTPFRKSDGHSVVLRTWQTNDKPVWKFPHEMTNPFEIDKKCSKKLVNRFSETAPICNHLRFGLFRVGYDSHFQVGCCLCRDVHAKWSQNNRLVSILLFLWMVNRVRPELSKRHIASAHWCQSNARFFSSNFLGTGGLAGIDKQTDIGVIWVVQHIVHSTIGFRREDRWLDKNLDELKTQAFSNWQSNRQTGSQPTSSSCCRFCLDSTTTIYSYSSSQKTCMSIFWIDMSDFSTFCLWLRTST